MIAVARLLHLQWQDYDILNNTIISKVSIVNMSLLRVVVNIIIISDHIFLLVEMFKL